MPSKKCPQCGSLSWEGADSCDCGYQFPQMPENLTTQPNTQAIKPNPEILLAKDLYVWLWVSPLMTLLTAFFIYETIQVYVFSVLGSALWHLILLIPIVKSKSEFVRWHGRQALLLAAARTVLALGTALLASLGNSSLYLGLILLVVLWLAGNLWGQGEAISGDCSLMRWTGHGAELPRPLVLQAAPSESAEEMPGTEEVDRLLEVIRFNPDPEQRRDALAELERLGLVEAL